MTEAEAPRKRAPAAAVWAAAVVVALAAAAIHAVTHRGDVFDPIGDESLLVPIAMRHVDPSLFAGDRWLATTSAIFSAPYSRLLGTMLSWFDDPDVTLRVLSIPFHAILLAGTWRVVERFAGRAAAAIATLLVAVPPWAGLVFAAGAALPRDLVSAALPWFVLAVLDTPSSRRIAGPAIFLGLGVLTNLHPLTGVHVAALLLGVGLLCEPTAAGLVAAALRGLAFLLGAAPYVAQYLARPVAAGAVDPAVYEWRLSGMAGEGLGAWALRMEPLLWLGAAACVLGVAAARGGTKLPRPLVAAAVVAFVLGALGPTLGRFVVPLRAVQLARLERVADWYAVVLVAIGAAAAGRRRALAPLAAAAACVAVGAWGPNVLGTSPPRGPVARAARSVERRAGVPFEPPAPPDLARRTAVDPTSTELRGAFLAVCRYAREETDADALFLVPPEHWAPFRTYARRGVAVTRKEGGAALSFLGAGGMDWYRDYAETVRVYADGSPEDWSRLASDWGARFAVLDRTSPVGPGWELVFAAGPFAVYAVPPR